MSTYQRDPKGSLGDHQSYHTRDISVAMNSGPWASPAHSHSLCSYSVSKMDRGDVFNVGGIWHAAGMYSTFSPSHIAKETLAFRGFHAVSKVSISFRWFNFTYYSFIYYISLWILFLISIDCMCVCMYVCYSPQHSKPHQPDLLTQLRIHDRFWP